MESRIVKFNIKQFIEEYVFLYESKDKEGEKELLNKFESFYTNSLEPVRKGVQMFLSNSKVAKEYKTLQDIATR